MRVTQWIVRCWREIFSTHCGAPSHCGSWGKWSLLTGPTLKWGMVEAHIELSSFFRFRRVWISPARLFAWWRYQQEKYTKINVTIDFTVTCTFNCSNQNSWAVWKIFHQSYMSYLTWKVLTCGVYSVQRSLIKTVAYQWNRWQSTFLVSTTLYT